MQYWNLGMAMHKDNLPFAQTPPAGCVNGSVVGGDRSLRNGSTRWGIPLPTTTIEQKSKTSLNTSQVAYDWLRIHRVQITASMETYHRRNRMSCGIFYIVVEEK